MPTFTAVGHISFSVTDCDKAAPWWSRVFGFPKEIEHVACCGTRHREPGPRPKLRRSS